MNKREANQVLKHPKFGDALCIAAANHLRVLRRLAIVRGLAEYHEIIYCGEHDVLGSKGFRLDCKCDSRTHDAGRNLASRNIRSAIQKLGERNG